MRNPIKMTHEGIVETVSIQKNSYNEFRIEKKISTNNEMSGVDFEPKLHSLMRNEADNICRSKVKSVDYSFEKIYVLDHAPGGFTLINLMTAIVKCNDSTL